MKCSLLYCLVVVGIMLLLPALALADSEGFSDKELHPSWHYVAPLAEEKYSLNGLYMRITSPDNALQDAGHDLGVKLLTAAPQEDFRIYTVINTIRSRTENSLHGVLLYRDANNWISVAKEKKAVIARGVIDGVNTGILATGKDMQWLQIRKDTRSGADVYRFYTGQGEKMWTYIGEWCDENHSLDGAEMGLISAIGYAEFDCFQCDVIEMESDTFSVKVLDGIWIPEENTTCSIENAALCIKGDGIVVRPRIHEDYVIYAMLNQRSIGSTGGLAVYVDEKNYLTYGGKDMEGLEALVQINGSTNVICQADDNISPMYFKIEKRGQQYIGYSSVDSMSWKKDFVYQDEHGVLNNALYGLASWGTETARIGWFQEMPASNGTIMRLNNLKDYGHIFGPAEKKPINETLTKYSLGSGDLGTVVQTNETIYMMLGDSFTGPGAGSEGWRSNVLLKLEPDVVLEEGPKVQTVICKPEGYAKEVIPCPHATYIDFTTIPLGGVHIGDTLYYLYVAISNWGPGIHLDASGMGWAYSTDGGQNFTRVDNIFTPNDRITFGFPILRDGYVYIFGTVAKRSGPRLARVAEADILDRSKYEFYAGKDASGQPVWCDDSSQAVILFNALPTELTVSWNSELQCYLMGYMDSLTDSIVLRQADELWGEWSNPVLLRAKADGILHYTPVLLDDWMDDKGIYFIMTNYNEYLCDWFHIDMEVTQAVPDKEQ